MLEYIIAQLKVADVKSYRSTMESVTLSGTAIDIVVHETWVELWVDGAFQCGNSNVDVIIENAIKAWKEYK